MKLKLSQVRSLIREEIENSYSDEKMNEALQQVASSIRKALDLADLPGHSFNSEPLSRMLRSIETALESGVFGDMSPEEPPDYDW